MDKSAIKTRLLELTRDDYEAAREKYETMVAEARVPDNEPLEHDQQSRAESNGELAAAWDEAMHDDEARLRRLNEIDFGAKQEVTTGAAVELDGRVLVVCVATPEVEVEGRTVMGISPAAPIYRAMEGLSAGDSFEFNGARHEIAAVH